MSLVGLRWLLTRRLSRLRLHEVLLVRPGLRHPRDGQSVGVVVGVGHRLGRHEVLRLTRRLLSGGFLVELVCSHRNIMVNM